MTLSDKITKSEEGMRVWQQERSIFEVTELICELMDDSGITRTELAGRLNKTKSHVSQLLDGESNMTIRTVSDVFSALGRAFHVFDGPLELDQPRHSYRFPPESWDHAQEPWSENVIQFMKVVAG